MKVKPASGVKAGDWLLARRWWFVALSMVLVISFEVYEYSTFRHRFDGYFWFETIFYGVALPLVAGLALSSLAASRADTAWLSYFLPLRNNLRMQLNLVHSHNELAELLIQFLRLVTPLVSVNLYIHDRQTNRIELLRNWSLNDSFPDTKQPFHCTWEACPLIAPNPEGKDESQCIPCRDADISAFRQTLPCYCLPFMLSGSPVASARLYFAGGHEPSPAQVRLLKSIAPEIAPTFERVALEQFMKRRNDNLNAEHQRLARDVHDTLGHSLAYLSLKLDQITMEFDHADKNTMLHDVEALQDVAKEAYDQMRGILLELNPENNANLYNTLLDYANKVSQRAEFKLKMHSHGQQRPISSITQRHIFYVFREALANIETHAQASHVNIDLDWGEPHLEITIVDDGTGFDVTQTAPEGHFGLANMRQRAMEIGAQFDIASQIGSGTRITFLIPYKGQL